MARNRSGQIWTVVLLGAIFATTNIAFAATTISVSVMRNTVMACSLDRVAELSPSLISKIVESFEALDREWTVAERAHIEAIRGVFSLKEKKYEEAEDQLTTSVELDPSVAFVFWTRARCRVELKDVDGAKADCEQCIQLNNSFVPAYLTMAAMAVKESDLEASADLLAKVQEIGVESEGMFYNYLSAILALKSRKPDQAREFANQALASCGTFMPVPMKSLWEVKMLAAVQSRNEVEMKFLAKTVLDTSPNNLKALSALWKVYRDEGNVLAALNVAERMIAVDPDSQSNQLCRMVSMVDAKQFTAAEKIAEQICKDSPDCKPANEVLTKIREARSKANGNDSLLR